MRLRNLAPLVSGAALVLVVVSAMPVTAQTAPGSAAPARVVKLRVDPVKLYKDANGEAFITYERRRFQGSWPVLGSEKGLLKVQVEGTTYWVRGYTVETDTPFRINADCDAVVASRQPKTGATRGIGEECNTKR